MTTTDNTTDPDKINSDFRNAVERFASGEDVDFHGLEYPSGKLEVSRETFDKLLARLKLTGDNRDVYFHSRTGVTEVVAATEVDDGIEDEIADDVVIPDGPPRPELDEAIALVCDAAAEQLRAKLAACLTVAEGATKPEYILEEGSYGWSLAYQRTLELRQRFDVLAVDPAVQLRAQIAKLTPRVVDPHMLPGLASALDAVTRDRLATSSRPETDRAQRVAELERRDRVDTNCIAAEVREVAESLRGLGGDAVFQARDRLFGLAHVLRPDPEPTHIQAPAPGEQP